MDNYEQKLQSYMQRHSVTAAQLIFGQSCHTVEEAANAVGGKPEDFIKSICLLDSANNLVVAVVKGEDKVDITKTAQTVGVSKLRIATKEEILDKTGYPCGGVPCFGYEATFLIDERVLRCAQVYGGGGSPRSLTKIAPEEIVRVTQGRVVSIHK